MISYYPVHTSPQNAVTYLEYQKSPRAAQWLKRKPSPSQSRCREKTIPKKNMSTRMSSTNFQLIEPISTRIS